MTPPPSVEFDRSLCLRVARLATLIVRVTVAIGVVLWATAAVTAGPASWWMTAGLVFAGCCNWVLAAIAAVYADEQYRAARHDW